MSLVYLNYNTFITNEGVTTMLHPGLYEQVINNALTSELAEIPEARKAVSPIDKAEASKVLAQYLADVVQKGLDIQRAKELLAVLLDGV